MASVGAQNKTDSDIYVMKFSNISRNIKVQLKSL